MIALYAALLVRLEFDFTRLGDFEVLLLVPAAVVLQVVAGYANGLYLGRWVNGSFEEFAALARTTLITTVGLVGFDLLAGANRPAPVSAVIGAGIMALVAMGGTRYAFRQALGNRATKPETPASPRPALRPWGGWRLVSLTAGAMALAGFSLWLRYRAIGTSSLWLDDAWVAVGSRVPTIGDTIRTGLTSPGFSLIYRGWAGVFGDGATTAQLLPLLLAVATPVALFFVAIERRLPVPAALFGGALLATATVHIDYSIRLKQYTAEALAATFVLWAAWRVVDRATDGRRWALLAGVAIAASLTSSVAAVAAGSAVAVGFVAALLARQRRMRPAVIASSIYGLVAGLWTVVAVKPNMSSSVLTDYWEGYFLDGSGFGGGVIARMEAVGRGFQEYDALLVLAGLLIAAALVLVRRPLVGLLLVTPTLVAIVLAASTLVPLGTGRTDIYLFPSYALLVAVAVAEIASLLPRQARLVGVATLVGAVGLALNATRLTDDAYPREELTPLVHVVEQQRQPGDVVVVYSQAGFAYGVATRYPIETVRDLSSGTGWVVKVNGPNIVVLPARGSNPWLWGPELDRLAAASKRIWVAGSHFQVYRIVGHQFGLYVLPDWQALLQMLKARGYQIVETHDRPGAKLLLFAPPDQITPAP